MSTALNFTHLLLPGSDPKGKYILACIAKVRFSIAPDGKLTPWPEPVKLVPGDKFYDDNDPLINACEVESDMMPYKLGAAPPRSRSNDLFGYRRKTQERNFRQR